MPPTMGLGRFRWGVTVLLLAPPGPTLSCPRVWAQDAHDIRGELVPGTTRYVGQIRVQGQKNPIALTTTIRDGGRSWIVEDSWTIGGNPSTETSVLEKGTLFLQRHRSDNGITRFEIEVRDGWISGWTGTPDSQDPREQIYVEAPDPIFAWGAGVPQVLARLPLAAGYARTFWNIHLPDKVVSRRVVVRGPRQVRIPAGEYTAWTVLVYASEPGGHDLAVWVDTKSRQVLRYDSRTEGPGPAWTLFLQP
jgi:hypothetical protein